MTTGDHYRVKAAGLIAQAKRETIPSVRCDLENLAQSYLLLAAQADRNSRNDVVYQTPPEQNKPEPSS